MSVFPQSAPKNAEPKTTRKVRFWSNCDEAREGQLLVAKQTFCGEASNSGSGPKADSHRAFQPAAAYA